MTLTVAVAGFIEDPEGTDKKPQVVGEITFEKSWPVLRISGLADRYFISSNESVIFQKGPPF
jgi:hypothetical protein